MEKFKRLGDLLAADPRSEPLGISLEREHARLRELELSESVPEDVRSYFNTVRMLYLFGYHYYGFFSLVPLHAAGVAELALRKIIPWEPKSEKERRRGDRRMLAKLLRAAVDQKLIRDEGFPRLVKARARSREIREALQEIGAELPPEQPFVEVLAKNLPRVRNTLAHPRGHTIITPAMILPFLEDTAALVRQLWPAKPTNA